MCDDGAWLEGGGLLRTDLSPKPAYLALHHLIHEQWTTTAQGTTDADGRFSFRGFRGTYQAGIGQDGQPFKQPFHLEDRQLRTLTISDDRQVYDIDQFLRSA